MKDNIDVSDGDTLLIPMPNVFLLLLDIAFISVILIGMFVFLFILLLLHEPVLFNMLSYFIVILFCFIGMEIKNRRYKPFVMTRDSIRFESHKRTGIWLDLSQSGPVSLIFHQSFILNGSNYGSISVEYLEQGVKKMKEFGIYHFNIYEDIRKLKESQSSSIEKPELILYSSPFFNRIE